MPPAPPPQGRPRRWSDLTPAQQQAVLRRRAALSAAGGQRRSATAGGVATRGGVGTRSAGARADRTVQARRPSRPAPDRRGGRDGRRRGFFWRWRRVWFALGFLLFAAVAGGFYALSRVSLPPTPKLDQTSFVYDAGGHVLTTYRTQNRVSVPLSKVPPMLVDAVVSTEDRHFFTEGAVNPVSIIRAFISDLQGNGSLQGGSTITQQYVKQAYLSPQRTLTRKIKEAALAVKLSHHESKDKILDGYLNTIYLGRGAYGVQAASEAYFAKPVNQIGLREASLLAGLIREPDTADPANNPGLARQNQTDTLNAMVRDGKITPAQASAVEAQPFSSYVVPASQAGASLGEPVAGDAYFLSAVRQQLLAHFPASEVDGGGLRVYTTLDPALQAKAYNTVYGTNPDALNPSKGEPAGALVSVDDSGKVRALVGGQGFNSHYEGSQVDLALGAAGGGSGRQAGSTFKAFMLAYLVKQGYSVYSTFPAPPEVIVPHGNANGTPWDVKNFEGEAGSTETSLVEATAQSINTVYAQVVEKLGASNLDAMAEAMGISPSELKGAYPSQVLGTADVSPLEMAAAYATFASNGVYTPPVLITKVTKANGSPLPWAVKAPRAVMSPRDAGVVTSVLRQVLGKGTGQAAGNVPSQVAGKTGTTENSANAWFIGYTPKLTTAVWMGYPAGEKPMVHFTHAGHFYKSVQGGDIPAQMWHTYMASVLASNPALGGSFPPVYYFGGQVLTPPAPGVLDFPHGMGNSPSTTVYAPSGNSGSTGGQSSGSSGATQTPTTTASRSSPATTAPAATPTTAGQTHLTTPTTAGG